MSSLEYHRKGPSSNAENWKRQKHDPCLARADRSEVPTLPTRRRKGKTSMLHHVERRTLVSRIAAARRIAIGAVGDVGGRITPSARRTSISTCRALLTTRTVTASTPRRHACRAGNLRVSLGSHARTAVSTLRLTTVATTAGARTTHWRLMA